LNKFEIFQKKFNEILYKADSQGRTKLLENEAYELLNIWGIKIPKFIVISNKLALEKDLEISKENLEIVKETFGKKLVLKILSPDIVHKTEVGGIKIIKNNVFELKKNSKNMLKEVKSKVPDANIFGVIISDFIKPEFELIASILNDPQFGPIFSVGMGGIYTELIKDIKISVAPVTYEKLKSLIKQLKCFPILCGYRGKKIIDEEKLLFTLMAINQLSIFYLDFNEKKLNYKNYNEKDFLNDFKKDFSNYTNKKLSILNNKRFSDYIIDEFEINPLAITKGGGLVAIDCIFRFHKKTSYDIKPFESPNLTNIEKFFEPENIAVVGASEVEDRPGTIIYKSLKKASNSLKESSFKKVFPVNVKREYIFNDKCYKSIKKIDEHIDLAILVVPAKYSYEIIKDAVESKVSAIIIISGGFRESGKSGEELEEKIYNEIKNTKTRVIGPNCLGIYFSPNNLSSFFLSPEKMKISKREKNELSILSQSGAVSVNLTHLLPNVGVRSIVSFGNMADVDISDLISYFDKDECTKVIALYFEGFKNGRKFYEVSKKLRKPLIVLKGGKVEDVKKATITHVGAMAGNYNIVKAVFRDANVIKAEDIQQFYEYIKIFALLGERKIEGEKIAFLSNSGGLGILGADGIKNSELSLAKYNEDTIYKIKNIVRGFLIVSNPTDIGTDATDIDYIKVAKYICDDRNVSALILLPGFEPAPIKIPRLIKNIEKICKKLEKPVVVAFTQTEDRIKYANQLENKNIPVFHSPERAVRALGKYMNYYLK
jgi:3-hydroxypropionyl-CoA synthetase (ADP-forming)